jgi:XTP/dITP diphosphohydrolase
MQLVLASNNAKKLRELGVLLAPVGVQLVAQGALGVSESEEPHHTFIENALLKARHAARHTNGAALADDSGLCVDALGGAPGVISAHFAAIELPDGERESQRVLQDAANNRLLLKRLHGAADRRARFISTLVAIRSADDPEPLVAVGRWEGEILFTPRGEGGFGYDPLMFIPALNASAADLAADVKNQHSHRALAVRQMLVLMREVWRIG